MILRRRAKHLRRETGRPIYTEYEVSAPPIHRRVLKSASRPLYLLATEPLLFASTLWSAFSFGTVFLFTQSVAQVFAGLYGWEEYSISYVQGAVTIGEIIGWPLTLYSTRLYLRSAARNTECPGRPIPEARLYVSVFGSFFGIVGGMFVYAWTAYPDFPWGLSESSSSSLPEELSEEFRRRRRMASSCLAASSCALVIWERTYFLCQPV